ncbi:hypothetical protein K2173_020536 [Erythroxylum novogranatense]|uniref:WPP domain-associated protein n=1 Tax=Erythroxylum novogranatense TaxID=1862640 RepID=A0AAV8TJ28_9ROSI|nr:hypothetical protein K2173_020536 [Erythroxylum novogranatense]
MEDILGKMGGRFKISITDSTMMWILHSAMNKAYERVQTKDGAIERLSEISKFYELAVMQLEGCLKVVHEEAESGLESSDEKLLAELSEIRDRLEGRLKETERAISEKDREFTERLENELKNRRTLKLQERELDSLRANLQVERTKAGGIEELVHGNWASKDEDRDEEFSELKSSVDQQVLNIKQKLDPQFRFIDRRRNKSFDCIKIEQMSSDIDILKETMDIAFGKMQSVMFFPELEPIEQLCRWPIERDAIFILIKGFMRDTKKRLNSEMRKEQKQVSTDLGKQLSKLLQEVKCLHDQLEPFSASKTKSTNSLEHDSCGKSDKSSPIIERSHQNQRNQLGGEDSDDKGSNLVAKMIKSHEFFIKNKSKEVNSVKREVVTCPSPSKEKDPSSPRRAIQEVIIRLESLVDWNTRLGDSLRGYEGDDNDETSSVRGLSDLNMEKQIKSQIDTLGDVWKNLNKSVSQTAYEKLKNKVCLLRKDREDVNFQMLIMEHTYGALLECVMSQYYAELCRNDLENLVRDCVCKSFFKEMANEWNETMEKDKNELQIKEEISNTVFSESLNQIRCALESALTEIRTSEFQRNCLLDLHIEDKLSEVISLAYFGEICRIWNEVIQQCKAQTAAKEELQLIAFEETIRDLCDTANDVVSEIRKAKSWQSDLYGSPLSNDSCQCIDCWMSEDICMVFFKEMSKLWKEEIDAYNLESSIREEIFLLVVIYEMNEATSVLAEAQSQDHFRISKDFVSSKKLHKNLKVSGEEILTQDQNSSSNIQAEDNLMQIASSDIKECNQMPGIVGLKQKQWDKLKVSCRLLIEMDTTSCSVSSTVHKALEKLAMSKAILSKLTFGLGVALEDMESFGNLMNPDVHVFNSMEYPSFQKEKTENATSDFLFSPILELSQLFMHFQRITEEKLRLNILRLDKTLGYLHAVADHVNSLKRKERLYKEAFIRRCENLRKAENEVDLLGDRVDVLLASLEKVYNTLHHRFPELQKYQEVSDLLEMIGKELGQSVQKYAKSS